MLSRAVASIFFEEHRPQKLPIHGLYAGVARDSCLPCKRYCRAVSRAAACRAPVALLVASRVNVPLHKAPAQSASDKLMATSAPSPQLYLLLISWTAWFTRFSKVWVSLKKFFLLEYATMTSNHILWVDELICQGWVTSICINKLNHHWFR